VYSRDAILHIPYAQKTELFKLAVKWLKPTGHLLLTDYGTRPDPSDKLKEYAKKRGYYLSTPEGYAEIVEDAGFAVVEGPDRTWDYVTR
jgi:phosphoethanolamine N-methyltransferase